MSYDQYRPTGFRVLPPVIKNLLIINALFFLATMAFGTAFGIDLGDKLGLHLLTSTKFHPYQFVTYMFMHGGISHIFFNMFALWMFGNVIENLWGPKRFLIYYFVTGIGAAMIYMLWLYIEMKPVMDAINVYLDSPSAAAFKNFIQSPYFKVTSEDLKSSYEAFFNLYNKTIAVNGKEALNMATDFMIQYKIDVLNAPVVVGASGAVFGLLLAFGMLFPNSLIYIYFLFPIKAKYFVIIYGVIELVSGIYNTHSSTAHFAHLGGMLFGFILIKLWTRNKFSRGKYRFSYKDYFKRILKIFKKSNKFEYDQVYKNQRVVSDEEYNAKRAEHQKKTDEILDKISKYGYDKLSKEEKEFLFKSGNDKL